ncbi:MAG: AMIN domain-containing protein [Gammaproteobacteria bacterium]|nr:AMIN domain-containing protein [Gammaproteobacteria bacterium]
MMRLLTIFLLSILAAVGNAAQIQVENLRMWPAPAKTRLVFDISAPVEHRVFTLIVPDRVVIDLKGAVLKRDLSQPKPDDRVISGLRSAVRKNGDLRVVLDLKSRVRARSFLLRPNRSYGHRLVLDLDAGSSVGERRPPPAVGQQERMTKLRDVVIAIDPGHGGEDPGAIGGKGTREKDVVLAIGRNLKRLIQRERGMSPIMIRKGDYYLRLRKRINLARKHKADFFISIHADAFRDPRVKGSSVYALSQRGATSEAARWLAERENSSDLIGGVSLDDKDDLLASVLLDLSQTATIEASLGVGDYVLNGLKKLGKTHKRRVQQAGFAVLKSPDIPSILIETGYISNRDEERRLRDARFQKNVAIAILDGLRAYFSEYAPPGTLMAAREHRIVRGDTLSELAKHYRVSLKMLRVSNDLTDDRLRVGQTLRIPPGQGS